MGIQTFDTANVYSNGLSETILGNAIRKFNLPREELVIMTKARLTHMFLTELLSVPFSGIHSRDERHRHRLLFYR